MSKKIPSQDSNSDDLQKLIKYYKKIKAKKLDDYIFQDYEEKWVCDYENPWVFKGEPFTGDLIGDNFGFVYCITNKTTGRKYTW